MRFSEKSIEFLAENYMNNSKNGSMNINLTMKNTSNSLSHIL